MRLLLGANHALMLATPFMPQRSIRYLLNWKRPAESLRRPLRHCLMQDVQAVTACDSGGNVIFINLVRTTPFITQSSSDPRYERIVATYTNAEMRKRAAARLGLTIHIPGRINQGGCKVDPDYQRGPKEASQVVSKPDEWRVDDLLNLLHGVCLPDTCTGLQDEMNQFLGELESVADALDQHEYQVTDAANSGIMARLIAFKKEKSEA